MRVKLSDQVLDRQWLEYVTKNKDETDTDHRIFKNGLLKAKGESQPKIYITNLALDLDIETGPTEYYTLGNLI